MAVANLGLPAHPHGDPLQIFRTTVTLDFDLDVVAWLSIAGLALALFCLLLAVFALVKVRRLRRNYSVLQGEDGNDSFVAAVSKKTQEVELLRDDVRATQTQVESLRVDLADAIRHVAVVRYDAFNDMGGRMSFSAAMLDDAGDGLVISSINGRTETRTYAKGVKSGESDAILSPEEEQAIGYAQRGTKIQ